MLWVGLRVLELPGLGFTRCVTLRVGNSRRLKFTRRPLSSSFLGLPKRILNINHKKELLRSLWVTRGLEIQKWQTILAGFAVYIQSCPFALQGAEPAWRHVHAKGCAGRKTDD